MKIPLLSFLATASCLRFLQAQVLFPSGDASFMPHSGFPRWELAQVFPGHFGVVRFTDSYHLLPARLSTYSWIDAPRFDDSHFGSPRPRFFNGRQGV